MYKKILVAGEGSRHAMLALRVACDLAVAHDAELVIVAVEHAGSLPEGLHEMAKAEHLVGQQPPGPHPVLDHLPEWIAKACDDIEEIGLGRPFMHVLIGQLLRRGEAVAKEHGVTRVRTIQESGQPAASILDCARREAVDLIVLGTRGHGAVASTLLGSVSHKVMQESECHCITVKSG